MEGLSLVLDFSGAFTTTCLEEELKTAAVIGKPKTAPTGPVSGGSAPWKEILQAIRPVRERSDTICRLSAPIKTSRGYLGTVTLERPGGADFSDTDVDLFNTFVNYAGIAAESARLFAEVERLATTDELTGVNNRRHFFEKASEEFRRADRLGHPISVVMFDIDHFKSFNDSYGHAIGDLVLRTVAQRCVDCLRSIDLIGRYGGEEFGVLLTGTGLSAAEPTAERLRAVIGDLPFESEAGPLTVTISLGVTERKEGESLEASLDRADKALYQAKESGRNRVTAS